MVSSKISLRSLTLLSLLVISGCSSLQFSEKKFVKPPLPKIKRVNVALVLGGGGAKGLAHLGVIEELEKAKIKPDIIIGCSAGSIVGAMYADSLDSKKIKKVLLQTKSDHLLKYSLAGFPFSLYSNYTFERFLKKNLNSIEFKSLKMPFIAVATDLKTGRLIPFGSGEIIPAVMASSAYPGAFFPVKIENSYFVDGGVSNPVPVSIAKQLGAKFIIAVDISEKLNPNNPNHFFGLLKRSLEISYLNHSKLSAKGADVTITMPFQNVGTFNDSMNYYLYRTGVNETRKKMPLIIKKLKSKLSKEGPSTI
ncbi:MAG: patatin-like phospholipase family protein [Legionella sp.]